MRPRKYDLFTATAADIERKFLPPMTELEELEEFANSLKAAYKRRQRRRKKKLGSRHNTPPLLTPAA
jgi:hypothetical protein